MELKDKTKDTLLSLTSKITDDDLDKLEGYHHKLSILKDSSWGLDDYDLKFHSKLKDLLESLDIIGELDGLDLSDLVEDSIRITKVINDNYDRVTSIYDKKMTLMNNF